MGAIALCAAASLMCAAMLGLASSQKQKGQRDLVQLQQREAINTAVLRFAGQIARAQGEATLAGQEEVAVPGGHVTVQLRAEFEGRKWPMTAIGDVEDMHLTAHTVLTRAQLSGLATGVWPKNDCVRTLFSTYGHNDPKQDFPTGVSVITLSGGHDGQVWRIRAVSGGRVQERLVRFLGDPDRLFAVVSQEDYALGEMPTCAQLTSQP
ncbi:hypothetical protein ABI_12990 [Asticcacaulis biprosthecium C19]|uniref:Uncharacterized protein n=2 Tax=Asticcacaulis biprosthecium TaxID=76891 RepID=F4QHZ4_9CAUL|nr:hypothetical protein ABI_12990 [Asticcacaulis biprosthecium C19]